jgi:hypothetical protein
VDSFVLLEVYDIIQSISVVDMPLSTYTNDEAAAFYQAVFHDSPRLPLMHDQTRNDGGGGAGGVVTGRKPLDVKMAVQPCRIVVRPLDLKRKGAGYQRLSVKPSESD